MQDCNIDILGTEYEIKTRKIADDPKLESVNGYCDQYSKKIVLMDIDEVRDDIMCVERPEEFGKNVLRHEIIHAFFGESGLRGCSVYAEDEELVDWLAIQSPKIFKVFKELELI